MKNLTLGSLQLGPYVFGVGLIGVLYTMFVLVARRHQRIPARRPHPRRADQPPLRHDPVHRLRGDVLRGLVLGLFRRSLFPGEAIEYACARPSPAGIGRRRASSPRPVASAAVQHADPADLGHDRDLGPPRAAARRPQGLEIGPDADGPPRRPVHLRAGLRICPRRFAFTGNIYGVDLLHGDRLPRLPCASSARSS